MPSFFKFFLIWYGPYGFYSWSCSLSSLQLMLGPARWFYTSLEIHSYFLGALKMSWDSCLLPLYYKKHLLSLTTRILIRNLLLLHVLLEVSVVQVLYEFFKDETDRCMPLVKCWWDAIWTTGKLPYMFWSVVLFWWTISLQWSCISMEQVLIFYNWACSAQGEMENSSRIKQSIS